MRLLGITIPENKRLEIGLTAIYGIGRVRAHSILKEASVDFGKKSALRQILGCVFLKAEEVTS